MNRNLSAFIIPAIFVASMFGVPTPGTAHALAQDQTETWLGTLDVQVAKLRIQINIKTDSEGNITADGLSPDQGNAKMKIDSITRTDRVLEFEIKSVGAKYKGTFNEDQTIATGTFTQGQAYDLEFKKVSDVQPDKHQATWQGTMKAGQREFEFQFRVFVDADGNERVKLDSLSESLRDLPCEMVVDDGKMTIDIPVSKAKFEGTLNEAKDVATGHWLQRGATIPLVLNKVDLEKTKDATPTRPQTPKPPFDYVTEDFKVVAREIDEKFDEGVELAGTLTYPKGDGPFPALILVSGSGPQDRDETLMQHKPFLVLADHLTKKGYAVIRFDDRGVGQSKGDFAAATTADFANDAETLFRWAQKHPKLDRSKVLVGGHSEGGLVAPMVAARCPEVAGVVMLAGPGVSGAEIVMNQSRLIAGASGATELMLGMQDKMLQQLLVAVENDELEKEGLGESLAAIFDDLPEDEKKGEDFKTMAEQSILKMKGPWFKYFLSYDPAENISRTKCPIFSVIGEKDLQVDPALNLPAIKKAVEAGGSKDFVQIELPSLNHLFQKCTTGSPTEYASISQTIDPSLLDALVEWLDKRYK